MKPLRYPIRAASKLTGIPVDTLRAWERRYGVVEPSRDARGRLYSDVDLERLRLLRRAVEAGHAIGRVAQRSVEELRALLEAPGPSLPLDGGAPVDLSALEDAVERFDAAAFRRELSRLAAVLPAHVLCRDVALPLLRLVGEAWHAGRLEIAKEHMVSAEIRSLLGALARLQSPRDGVAAIVFATPEGELHEIGTLAAAIVAGEAGLAALYLGPNLPAGEIASAAARIAAKVVVLGWTGGGADSGRRASRVVAELARALPGAVELWVGGAGASDAERATGGRAVPMRSLEAFERALHRVRRE